MSSFDDLHTFTDAGGVSAQYRLVGPRRSHWALLLHGHTQTSLMWRACADELADIGFQVIVPDIGLRRADGDEAPFTKTQIASVCLSLIDEVAGHTHPGVVIGHDLGAMIGYALAATARGRIAGLAVLEATPPGVGFWQNLLMDPRAWHFGFYGPYAEQLVAGREEIYLERFWTEFSAKQESPMSTSDQAAYLGALKEHGGCRRAFAHFQAFPKDCEDNAKLAKDPLEMPVLALGGEMSFGPMIGYQMQLVASQVEIKVISNAGHWVLEENGLETRAALLAFAENPASLPTQTSTA